METISAFAHRQGNQEEPVVVRLSTLDPAAFSPEKLLLLEAESTPGP